MKTKKSQMEIMGLAIIVVLVVLGFAFAIRFSAQKKPVEFKEDYTTSEIISNIINTLLKTTATADIGSDCRGMSFSELLVKCSEKYDLKCDGSTPICTYTHDKMKIILDQTLKVYYPDRYYLSVINEDFSSQEYINDEYLQFNLPEPDSDPCTGKRNKKSTTWKVPTTTINNIIIKLDVCGQ